MAANIGQYAPVFLPGEAPSLTEKPGRPQTAGSHGQTLPKSPCTHRHKMSFACGSSAPVRVECEGGAAAWLVGTLAALSVQGCGLSPLQELWPYQSLFSSLLYLTIRRPLGQSFSIALPIQALRRLPYLGSFSVFWCMRHIEGPPTWGPTL